MVLGTIQQLCGLCDKLLQILAAQQVELQKLGCNPEALRQWTRETDHLREMLRQINK